MASGSGTTSESEQAVREILSELVAYLHSIVPGLERHRHRAECCRVLTRAVGGCISRNSKSGVKKEMTGEA